MLMPLTFVGDDVALMRALRAGHPGAAAVFYDQHANHVHRTLRAALGTDEDLADLLQEVFIRALGQLGKLRDTQRVRSWLTTIAVFVAREQIRLRARRRSLSAYSPEHTRPRLLEQPSLEARQALSAIYGVLDGMPVNERMAFVLRFVEGMTLPDAAEGCGVSLATLKRRLARAESLFLKAAREVPAIEAWLEKGERWSTLKQG